jgi:TonB-dependent starch-binding outer membrane protein SusC
MKKQRTIVGLIFLLMKFSLLQILLAALFSGLVIASPENSFGQTVLDEVISIRAENQKVKSILAQIERSIETKFAYNPQSIPLHQKVSLTLDNEKLSDVLEYLLSPFQVDYEVSGDYIILSKHASVKDRTAELIGTLAASVSGTVTEESGEPLPGVNVLIKGTTIGTTTDAGGSFTIEVPDENSILVFSFIGYVSQEVVVGSRSVINLALTADVQSLEEVVVVGYGTVKKSDLTGAVGSVGSESISRTNPVQAARALQGQVAGVNVNKINSRPGSDYTIDIRGVHSISFSSEPLVVIDGVMGGKLNTLNPSDIESMDVLKDASATAIYGARGANGVIIITTKKGRQGKTKVTYDGYTGLKIPTNLPDMMTAQEFYHAYNDVVIAENPSASPVWTATELANVQGGRSVDWVDQVTDPAAQTNHVISLSGGNENTTHYFSTGYLSEKGNLLNTGFERFNLKGSVDSKLSDVVKVGFNTYFTYSTLNLGSNETLRGAYRVRPTGSILFKDLVNPSETNDKDVRGYAFWMGIKDTQIQNPILEVAAANYKDETRASSFLGNAYVELSPVKGLSLRSSFSASVYNSRRGEFRGKDSKARLNKLPIASNNYNLNGSYTWDNILTYKLKSQAHELMVTAGQSLFQERFEESRVAVENLPYNSAWYAINTAEIINSVSSNLVERSILSYMGRINYIFKDKYLLTLTGRYDGSSVLAEGNQWAFFPSAALAWRMGDEPFISDLNLFSDLKARISYGRVGNDVVSPYSTQAYLGKTAYDFNGAAAYGYAPANIGNSDLRWENSEEFNFGLNMGFVNNRIMVDAEYYNKTTNDLIQNVALPTSFGFGTVTANVGKLLNRGIEISIGSVNVQKGDFKWTSNLNFSKNHNEILELYGGTITQDIANKLFVGKSLKSNYYYEFDGIWQLDEVEQAKTYGQVPGSIKVVDQNGDGKITSSADADDRIVLGNELPDWIAGITNVFYYKNWDFSFFIYTRQGVQYRNAMLSGTFGELGSSRYNRLNLNYWTATNPTNDYFGVWQPNPYREAIQYKDASFWRVQNVTLGYNLPAAVLSRWHMSNLRIYLKADNALLFTREKNIWMDPEFNSGTYQDDVPFSTVMVGLNLSL